MYLGNLIKNISKFKNLNNKQDCLLLITYKLNNESNDEKNIKDKF